MWTIYICVAILAVYSLLISFDILPHNGWEDDFIEGIFRLFCSVLGGAILGFLIGLAIPSKMIEEKSTFKLMNLQDGSQVNGHFFLGSGVIEGKMTYAFYYEIDSVNFAMSQIPYDVAKIRYTNDSTTAYIEQYQTVDDKNYFLNHFSIDTDYGDKRFVIYVPKGTIKSNYNLDAQ